MWIIAPITVLVFLYCVYLLSFAIAKLIAKDMGMSDEEFEEKMLESLCFGEMDECETAMMGEWIEKSQEKQSKTKCKSQSQGR
jgi:hypothetical protein